MFGIIEKNHEKRPETGIDCSEPILTDQSFSQSCDINVIMAQYQKTGLLPSFKEREPRYIDNTETPDLMQAFDIAHAALDHFNALPAEVRKAMENNPANLETFIADPTHQEFLVKHGVLEIKKVEEKKSIFTPEDLATISGKQDSKKEKT